MAGPRRTPGTRCVALATALAIAAPSFAATAAAPRVDLRESASAAVLGGLPADGLLSPEITRERFVDDAELIEVAQKKKKNKKAKKKNKRKLKKAKRQKKHKKKWKNNRSRRVIIDRDYRRDRGSDVGKVIGGIIIGGATAAIINSIVEAERGE